MNSESKTNWSDKLPSQILFEAANALEAGDYWRQGGFFGMRNEKPCFCAHGAIQYCGREPKIRKLIEAGAYAGAVAGAYAGAGAGAGANFSYWLSKFQTQPCYQPYLHLFLAHYFAAKIGCTYSFNDHPGRTKEEVILKLREAAALALENQHQYISLTQPSPLTQ